MPAMPLSALDLDMKFQPEGPLLDRLVAEAALSPGERAAITATGAMVIAHSAIA